MEDLRWEKTVVIPERGLFYGRMDGQNGHNGRKGRNCGEAEVGSRRALRSSAAGRVYGKHGGYRQLKEVLFEEARGLRPKTLAEAAAWVNQKRTGSTVEERADNLGAILSAQAHYLTERLLDRQAREFEQGGGFSERLYQARRGQRGQRKGG